MCERAVEDDPGTLEFVPDHDKTQGMCDKAVRDHFFSLKYVRDWFYDDSEYGMMTANVMMMMMMMMRSLSGTKVIKNARPKKQK